MEALLSLVLIVKGVGIQEAPLGMLNSLYAAKTQQKPERAPERGSGRKDFVN